MSPRRAPRSRRRSREPLGDERARGGGRHPPHRRHAHGRRGPRLRGQARRRSRPHSRCCRSAAPAPSMPPRSPTSSACAASWCRRGRARSRRSGCSAPTWCTTTSARSCGRSTEVAPDHAEAIFRGARGEGARGPRGAKASTAADARIRARARPALYRPGLRAAHAARRHLRRRRHRGDARGGAQALRRAPCANSRPCGRRSAGRDRELSAAGARAVPKYEPRAGRRTPRRRRAPRPRAKGERAISSRRQDARSRARSTSATGSPSARRSTARPSSSSSTPRPSSRPAGRGAIVDELRATSILGTAESDA